MAVGDEPDDRTAVCRVFPKPLSLDETLRLGSGQLLLQESAAKKNCGLTTRRWHQLFALGFGLLEVGFSVSNAVSEDAFKVRDAKDFVFSPSAIMESVGLAVLLLASLHSKMRGSRRGRSRKDRMETGEIFWGDLGRPLQNPSERHPPERRVLDTNWVFRLDVSGSRRVCARSDISLQRGPK